jgi:hypothetical protein
MKDRTLLMYGAAALVLSASIGLFAAGGNAPGPLEVTAARSTAPGGERSPAPPAEDLRLDLLQRAVQAGPQRDAFSARAWQQPAPARAAPPASVEPPPPPPPTAPPLPFAFMGRFDNPGDKTVYYLVEGDKLHTVSEGETINGIYRIEAVKEISMDILYLPLAITQSLALGPMP